MPRRYFLGLFYPRLFFRLRLCPCVVLLVVDVFGSRVLFLVDLLLLTLRLLDGSTAFIGEITRGSPLWTQDSSAGE
jgi:hypothetical protein